MEYLLFLQGLRESTSPFINNFMNATSNFVIGNGCIILLFVITYIFDKKLGRRICAAYSFNIFINVWAKGVACISRPWVRDSRIIPAEGMKKSAASFSFPSGHASISGSLFVPIIAYVKNNIIKIISVLAILLVCFSRNYIGVHTLEDVVVGFLMSIVGCVIMFKTFNYIEEDEWDENGHTKDKVNNRDIVVCLIIIIIFIIGTLHGLYKSYPATVTEAEIQDCKKQIAPVGVLMVGQFVGVVLERRFVKFNNDASLITKIIRVIVGFVVLILISKCLYSVAAKCFGEYVGGMIRYGLPMFNITFLTPLIFTTYEKLLKLK